MRGIIRGDTNLDPVPNYYLDLVLLHPAGKYTNDLNPFVTLDFHGSSTQRPLYHAF